MQLCRGVHAPAVLTAALGASGSAAAASNHPAGNRAAIAFYDRSEAVMARFQEITFFGRGLSYHVPSRSGVLYVVGFTPPGFKQARDRVSVIQRQGKVVEEGDRLSPSGLPALTIWHERRDKRIARVQRPAACARSYRPRPPSTRSPRPDNRSWSRMAPRSRHCNSSAAMTSCAAPTRMKGPPPTRSTRSVQPAACGGHPQLSTSVASTAEQRHRCRHSAIPAERRSSPHRRSATATEPGNRWLLVSVLTE